MAFLEERLPDDIERGAQGGPRMSVSIFTSASGFEKRNRNWNEFRRQFDISYGVQARINNNDPDDGFDRILDFYHITGGETDGFRFRDYSDFKIGNFSAPSLTESNTGFIVTGDGVTTDFQTIKRRSLVGINHDRIIRKIASDSSGDPIIRAISVDGGVPTELTFNVGAPGAGEFTVNANTGVITTGDTLTGSQTLRVAAEFDVPVRFASDILEVQMVIFERGSVPPIMLRELRQS